MNIRYIITKSVSVCIMVALIVLLTTGCQKNNSISNNEINNIKTTKDTVAAPQNTPTSTSSQSTIIYADDNVLARADTQIKFTLDDLSIYDVKTQKLIKLGMSKKEVDETLEIRNPKKDHEYYIYDKLKVFYRNNKAAGFRIDQIDGTTTRFMTSRKVKQGDNIKKVRKIYGQGNEYKDGSYIHEIYDVENVNDILFVRENEEFKTKGKVNPENLYSISISMFKNKVSFIIIGDYHFTYEGS